MTDVDLRTFKGESPRTAPRALGNEMAVKAVNARLQDGDLQSYRDIANIHVLGKTGPINTIVQYEDDYWLTWKQSEINSGETNVDFALVPTVGDTTDRAVFTGADVPQITNHALAINPDVGPYGPYPDGSINLAVPAPTVAPTVSSAVPLAAPIVTRTQDSTFSLPGWTSGVTGGSYGSFSINPPFMGTPSIDSHQALPTNHGFFQDGNQGYLVAPTSFDFANCVSFTHSIQVGPDVNTAVFAPNVFATILGGGLIGFRIDLGTSGTAPLPAGGAITYTDQASGGSPVQFAAPGAVSHTHAYQIDFTATNNGLDNTSTRHFTVRAVVTRLSDGVVVGDTNTLGTPVIATYGGEEGIYGGINNSGGGDETVYVSAPVWVVTTNPTPFIPVFSNYVYTLANQLGLESQPSPASAVVQVDNNYVNTITIPPPPTGYTEAYLFRAATGSTGTEYLAVENGSYADGGFPFCVDTGTANALVLADVAGTVGPLPNTYYFFKATATNTGAATANLNATGAHPIVTPAGAALPAGSIVAGNPYTLIFEQTITVEVTAPAVLNATMLSIVSNAGIINGQPITDSAGAIQVGTTVVGSTGGGSPTITLSKPIIDSISVGDTLTIPSNSGNFTLLSGYTFIDATPTADLGDPLTSAAYDPPPDNLRGILAMPNKYLSGFFGKTFYPGVPGQPQAFPLDYALATDSPIVATAAVDANSLILTTDHPYTAWGTDPATLQMSKERFSQGCASKLSVSYLEDYGVVYASTDGIYAYGGLGQIRCLTRGLFTIREWKPLNPPSILGIVHQKLYFFWYKTLASATGGYILDPDPNGFGLVELDFHVIAAYVDSASDTLYFVIDAGVISNGASSTNNTLLEWAGSTTLRPYTWKSKLFQFSYRQWMQIMRVRAESYAGMTFILYANGVAYSTFSPTNDVEFTLPPPPDGACEDFQLQITGTCSIQTVNAVENVSTLT